jgi:hypothetical protein
MPCAPRCLSARESTSAGSRAACRHPPAPSPAAVRRPPRSQWWAGHQPGSSSALPLYLVSIKQSISKRTLFDTYSWSPVESARPATAPGETTTTSILVSWSRLLSCLHHKLPETANKDRIKGSLGGQYRLQLRLLDRQPLGSKEDESSFSALRE